MHLTPHVLEAAYSFLRETLPFRRWRLPPADEVEFHVNTHRKTMGEYDFCGGRHVIRISAAKVAHTYTLIEVMAHEMVHLRAQVLHDRAHHGRIFRALAARVCRQHGFDPRAF